MNYNENPHMGYGNRFGQETVTLQTTVTSVMKRVYVKMMLGLLVTAFVAWFCAGSDAFKQFVFNHSWTMWAFIIAEFGLVIGISAGINRLSSAVATMLFYLFAAVNGLTLWSIFLIFSPEALVKTFFITAGTFGAMSVFGFFTSQNLAKFGSFLMMALFGLIIASLVNIFLPGQNATFDWIISILGVLIFVGLTAWDTQQIKNMAMTTPQASLGRLATLGALSLYLDFINLFLYLLRIFGNRD